MVFVGLKKQFTLRIKVTAANNSIHRVRERPDEKEVIISLKLLHLLTPCFHS